MFFKLFLSLLTVFSLPESGSHQTGADLAIKTVVLDLAAADYTTVRTHVASAIENLDVAILINNAGK